MTYSSHAESFQNAPSNQTSVPAKWILEFSPHTHPCKFHKYICSYVNSSRKISGQTPCSWSQCCTHKAYLIVIWINQSGRLIIPAAFGSNVTQQHCHESHGTLSCLLLLLLHIHSIGSNNLSWTEGKSSRYPHSYNTNSGAPTEADGQ